MHSTDRASPKERVDPDGPIASMERSSRHASECLTRLPLSESLTVDQVRAIAALARLALSDAELATLAPQLDAIVGYVALLDQVRTDGVEPLAHALPVQNVFREDEASESLSRDQALANAPRQRDGCFAVPAVLE